MAVSTLKVHLRSDLHVVHVAVSPPKAHPPLIIDPDAVLSLAIPRELLEPVAWWNPQILERFCAVSPEDLLGLPVTEAPNHRTG